MIKDRYSSNNFKVVYTLISIIFQNLINTILKILKSLISHVYDFLKVVFCFVTVYYLWLPTFLLPFILLLVYRTALSIIFKVVHREKYKLMEAADAAHTFDSYANINTITFFIYVDGPIDIEELQSRVEKLFLKLSNRTGKSPYWKLLYLARRKFGFMCWEDMSSSFDVEQHVRYLPGFDQNNQVYREADLFEAISELSCKEWDCNRPKWEFLVTPQLQVDDASSVYSAITVRISHEYGDGISIMQMFRNNIFDRPAPQLLIDPVNIKIKIPFYAKLFMYTQAFIFGPACIMKFLSYKDSKHVAGQGSLTGPKFFGRNKSEIPLEMIRQIRTHFRVSTSAVYHSAFCGALCKLSERRCIQVPRSGIGGMAYGLLPYPNDHLQNHFTPLVDEYPVGIEDPIFRVKAIEKCLCSVVKPHSLLTTSLVYSLMGLLPARAIEGALGVVNIMFVVSNVPGFLGDVRFGGYPVDLICGSPPSCKGISKLVNFWQFHFL